MVSKELSEAAVELNVILENTSPEIVSKIPKKFIVFLKEIASKNYIFKYDNTKSLEEQDIRPKTKGLLALIYRDFLCDNQEKQEYINRVSLVTEKIEQRKREKYNPDKIFKNNMKENTTKNNNEDISIRMQIVEYKEPMFKRIINRIFKFFRMRGNKYD